jgi:uncharacterized protein YbjT (DUF2867 family)
LPIDEDDKLKIAIAGAFGFIGQHLINSILDNTEHEIVAFSRSVRHWNHPRVQCVTADLYSLSDIIEGLSGCDHAIYLVHSMAPNARLSQGHFRDFDFILADNFMRAAQSNGLSQITYVGGMIPTDENLSPHLESRLEVEEVLRSGNVPTTTLRCGLVIGHKASSFSIIVRLTNRLPVMILPQWMRTVSNPIYVKDLTALIISSMEFPCEKHRIIDAGMDQKVSYKDIVIETARVLNKTPTLIDVSYVSPHLSKLWVRLVGGAPKALVYPLIDSVRHEMLKSPDHGVPKEWDIKIRSLNQAIGDSFEKKSSHSSYQQIAPPNICREIRSVQRFPLAPQVDALWVANKYLTWLPLFLIPFLKLEKIPNGCKYRVRFLSILLLTLRRNIEMSNHSRQVFNVGKGVLVRGNRAIFEFRQSHDHKFIISAIHNFEPALPWPIYRSTQAVLHKVVMSRFGKLLEKST